MNMENKIIEEEILKTTDERLKEYYEDEESK